MVDYSDDQYHKLRHPEFLDGDELLVAWSYFADLAYFNAVQAGQSVLEFGGGLGNNLVAVSKRARVCMVEPAQIGRESAQAHGIEAFASLEELKGRRFDFILCRHVLEHVEHPLGCLRELGSYLTEHGQLVVVLPVERINQPPDPADLNHHLHCWNPQTLHNLMVKAGFNVVDWHYEHYGARRRLLPIYRKFGGSAYARWVRLVGRIFCFRELVAVARRSAARTDSM